MNPINMPVEEYTTPNPVTAPESARIEDLVATMKEFGVRHIPIVSRDRVVGIVSDRDLKLVMGLNLNGGHSILASEIMVKDPVTVAAGAPLDEVAFEMSRSKIGSVIVNDEQDKLLGIFTVTDALNALVEIVRGQSDSDL